MAKYVVGVDGGTGGIRAGLFEIATGTPVGFADTPYETTYPRPGWAEQDPNDWWAGMGSSVRKVLADTGVAASDVAGICCDTTCCTVVALDDAGDPLMPCILWMDMRAAEQTKQVLATGDVALRVNSDGAGPVSAEWMVPKALWLKQHRPELFAQAAKVCEYQDYVNLKLTGRYCASANNVAVRWHFVDGQPPGVAAGQAGHAGARGEVAEGRGTDGTHRGAAVGCRGGAPRSHDRASPWRKAAPTRSSRWSGSEPSAPVSSRSSPGPRTCTWA